MVFRSRFIHLVRSCAAPWERSSVWNSLALLFTISYMKWFSLQYVSSISFVRSIACLDHAGMHFHSLAAHTESLIIVVVWLSCCCLCEEQFLGSDLNRKREVERMWLIKRMKLEAIGEIYTSYNPCVPIQVFFWNNLCSRCRTTNFLSAWVPATTYQNS